MEYKPHVTKKKGRVVDDLVSLMNEYPVVGIIDMSDLPALQFQRIKFKLSDKLEFRLVKKRLMKIAFDRAEKKGIEKLKERLDGIPALIFTKEDPFKIAKAINKEVSAAPARAGQIAPEDMVLSAGPTPFTPGPMIGELGAMGIKTKVESGKINVIEDKVLVKKGDIIEGKIADLMSKLGMEPMQVGFNLILTYKDGEILEKAVLFVDDKLYLETLGEFARESEGLAIYIGYICKDIIEKMIGKAYNEAEAVSDVVKMEEPKEVVEDKPEEKPVEEKPQEEVIKEEEKPVEEEKVDEAPKVEEKPQEEIKEEPKVEEPVKEKPKVEEQVEEPKEEIKEEPQQEKVEEPEKEEPEVEEKPEEEIKEEEPEKEEEIKEEPKEEPEEEPEEKEEEKKEEPKEEKTEEKKLKDIKEDTKIGMKSAKDISKKDIDLAARQLQEIQDKMIKGGK